MVTFRSSFETYHGQDSPHILWLNLVIDGWCESLSPEDGDTPRKQAGLSRGDDNGKDSKRRIKLDPDAAGS